MHSRCLRPADAPKTVPLPNATPESLSPCAASVRQRCASSSASTGNANVAAIRSSPANSSFGRVLRPVVAIGASVRSNRIPSRRPHHPTLRRGRRRARVAGGRVPQWPGCLRAYDSWQLLAAPINWLCERRLESRVRSGPLRKHIGIIMDATAASGLSSVDVHKRHHVGATGTWLWEDQRGSSLDDEILAIVVGSAGDVLLAGMYTGRFDTSPDEYTNDVRNSDAADGHLSTIPFRTAGTARGTIVMAMKADRIVFASLGNEKAVVKAFTQVSSQAWNDGWSFV